MSLGRGAEYLTVLQRDILRVHGDIAPDRLWAAGHRGGDLCVRQPHLVGINMDCAAVTKRRLRRDRALLTGEPGSAIDVNGAAIEIGLRDEDRLRRVICGKVGVNETHSLRPRKIRLCRQGRTPLSSRQANHPLSK